jgi:hypothetical protein
VGFVSGSSVSESSGLDVSGAVFGCPDLEVVLGSGALVEVSGFGFALVVPGFVCGFFEDAAGGGVSEVSGLGAVLVLVSGFGGVLVVAAGFGVELVAVPCGGGGFVEDAAG